MRNLRASSLLASITLILAVAGCGGEVETDSTSQGSGGQSQGSSVDVAPPDDNAAGAAFGSDQMEVRVTGPYFTGTQTYSLPSSAFSANLFDSATYLNSRSAGEGADDVLANGSDGSGLYRVSVQIQGGQPGSYAFGDGNQVTLYLRNNGTPDPRCDNTGGPCTGVALSMIDGTIEIEAVEEMDDGHRLKLNFSGTFERTDTPGNGRDTYQVAGNGDLIL